jgi:hypothetical protein
MSQVKWDVALYLDSRATPPQRDALTQIFSGQAGGHPAVVASFIGRALGIKSAVIDYQASGNKRSVKIGDIAEAEVEAIQGQNQQQATISNRITDFNGSCPARTPSTLPLLTPGPSTGLLAMRQRSRNSAFASFHSAQHSLAACVMIPLLQRLGLIN